MSEREGRGAKRDTRQRRSTSSEKESGGEGSINTHENGNACIGSPCRRARRRHGWPPVSPLYRFSPTSSLPSPFRVSSLSLLSLRARLLFSPETLLNCALRLCGSDFLAQQGYKTRARSRRKTRIPVSLSTQGEIAVDRGMTDLTVDKKEFMNYFRSKWFDDRTKCVRSV